LLQVSGRNGHTIKDPLFASVVTAWIIIYLIIPVTGFYINFNETFYSDTGSTFTESFTRFHQDVAMFLLSILVTTFLVFEIFGMSGISRKRVGYLYISGTSMIFIFGESYSMITLNQFALYGAGFGGVLIAVGALIGARYLYKTRLKIISS